jgi:dTDP-4-dehydrorhamnose reductase
VIIVVMGPSGCGKTTIGRALATALAWPFVDADDLHDAAARAKMAAGVPLDEADRAPWLARVCQRLTELAAAGPGVVLACSALRRQHRDTLRATAREVHFLLLEADEATLSQRVAARRDHFMPATLVASQLATLERSPDLVSVDATRPCDEIVVHVRTHLGLSAGHGAIGTVLVTGLRGTVGQALQARLRQDGVRVVGWDRSAVPIDQYDAMERFVAKTAPGAIVHLAIASSPTGRDNEAWLVNYEWPSQLAWITRQLGIRFVHASTVMVFSGTATGPFTVDSVPDATEGYGYEKRMAEQRVKAQNPHATIARLGWQIGEQPGSNNMIDFFDRETRAHGRVGASTRWRPACSFLDDTAEALARLLRAAPGCYLLDSNARWTFFEIARAISACHHDRWKVVPVEEPTQDQRMIDPRVAIASLATRLPSLAR